jgi:hypothetical protein
MAENDSLGYAKIRSNKEEHEKRTHEEHFEGDLKEKKSRNLSKKPLSK